MPGISIVVSATFIYVEINLESNFKSQIYLSKICERVFFLLIFLIGQLFVYIQLIFEFFFDLINRYFSRGLLCSISECVFTRGAP